MKVLQIHTRYRQPGGEDSVVRAEAALLRAAGHDVMSYEAENPAQSAQAIQALAQAPWNRGAARAMRDLVRHHRPDVAHVHNTWFSLSPAILPAIRDEGVPVVVTLHNYRLLCVNALLLRDGRPCEDCVGTHPWRSVVHGCYRGSRAASVAVAATISLHRRRSTWDDSVDLLLTPTQFTKDRLVSGGLAEHSIRVKPNFVPGPPRRPISPSASRTLAYVGRLSAEKGCATLLSAWEESSLHEQCELVVIGDGPLRAQLENRRVRGVRFEGVLPHDRVLEILEGTRCLVVPSEWYEVQGMVVLEAMALGRPVLASALGGLAETVRPLGEQWLVAAQDVAAWARGLRRLLDDEVVDEAGQRARDVYAEQYCGDVALANLEEAYADARSRFAASGGEVCHPAG